MGMSGGDLYPVDIWQKFVGGRTVTISDSEYQALPAEERSRFFHQVKYVSSEEYVKYQAGLNDVAGKSYKRGYVDLPYIRQSVTDRDIIAAVRQVLGLKEGEAVPLVFDGKVTPVVVVNDYTPFSSWKLLGVSGSVGKPFYVDNFGFFYCDDTKSYDRNFNLVGTNFNYIVGVPTLSRNYVYCNDGNFKRFYFKGRNIFSYDCSFITSDFVDFSGEQCMSDSGKYYVFSFHDAVMGHVTAVMEGVV